MTYIGIDPGKAGAMAILDGDSYFVTKFEQGEYISALLGVDPKQSIVCLEHVHAMPGQGVTSMFSFGQNLGWIQGVLETLGIPYELVTPQKWKREFSISDKNGSVSVCKRLFPYIDLRRTERCRKDDDGIAEAVLMAEYARRRLGDKHG